MPLLQRAAAGWVGAAAAFSQNEDGAPQVGNQAWLSMLCSSSMHHTTQTRWQTLRCVALLRQRTKCKLCRAAQRASPPGSACPTSPKGVHAHLAQHVVQQRLAQQHAIGHVLDHRLLAGAVLKPNGVADLREQGGAYAERGLMLAGGAVHRGGPAGAPPRLQAAGR